MKLIIDYPENLADVLQESPEQLEKEMRTALAVKLFEMKRISSGMAAELAGIDRVSFLLELSRFSVPMLDLNDDELTSDFNNV
jgi:predicted HTH domain antitoxin